MNEDLAAPRAAARTVLDLTLRSVTLPSGEISYVEEGSGTPIILLHGAPLTSLGFLRVIRELRAHYRVIAPDFPGFGYSTRSPDCSGSLASYARFVEDFCRALGLTGFFVYVNDSSACIGLSAIANVAAEVAGIVVADTVPIPLTGRAWLVKLALEYVVTSRPVRFLNRRFNVLPWLVVCVAPLLRLRPFSAIEPAVLLAQFDTPDKRDYILDIFGNMGRDEAFMRATAKQVREHLADTPALILCGQFDPMRFVGGVSRWKRFFRESTVRIIPFEEHFPILASGERVARIVHEWLGGLPQNGT